MSIKSLPSEVLAQILSFGQTHSVLPLWLCGDALLNHHLAHGGAPEIRLKNKNKAFELNFPILPSRLPGLRKLSIFRAFAPLGDSANFRNALQSLGPSLLHLDISCLGVIQAFCEPEDESQESSNDRFDGLPPPGVAPASNLVFWDQQPYFPNIQVLILSDHTSCKRIKDDNFGKLSRSLLHVDLPVCVRPAKYLPPESNQPDNNEVPIAFDLLPRSLTFLRINFESNEVAPSSLVGLPPHLTDMASLPLRIVKYPEQYYPAQFEEIRKLLPESLTKLRTEGNYNVSLLSLPNLQEIYFGSDAWLNDTLPPSLKSATMLRSSCHPSGQHLARLPPGLTKLIIRNLDFRKITPKDIPAQLLDLFCVSGTISDNIFAMLPRTMTSLVIWSAERSPKHPDTFANLPPSLVALTWCVKASDDDKQEATTIYSTKLLPRTIKRLTIKDDEMVKTMQVDSFVAGLPPRLHTLRLDIPAELSAQWTAHLMANLPTTLTDISLSKVSHTWTNWWDLSRLDSLARLRLVFDQARTSVAGMATCLPNSLHRHILGNATIPGCDLDDLPSDLSRLSHDSTDNKLVLVNWRPDHFDTLPPRLKILNITFDLTNAPECVAEDLDRFPWTLDWDASSLLNRPANLGEEP